MLRKSWGSDAGMATRFLCSECVTYIDLARCINAAHSFPGRTTVGGSTLEKLCAW